MSKFLGCGLGGLLSGLRKRESFAVAAGMNARGGMGIVVALIGLALGVLTPEMYTIILIMAILTSLIAPPLLEWSLGAIPESPGDEERTEREKALGKLPFTREGAKLLVLDAGGPHARMATHLAAALGNHHEATITIFRVTPAELSDKARADLKERFAELKAIAESCGAQNVLERTATGESPAALILEEAGRGYDAIFAGASHLNRGDRLGGAVLGELLTRVAHAGAGGAKLSRVATLPAHTRADHRRFLLSRCDRPRDAVRAIDQGKCQRALRHGECQSATQFHVPHAIAATRS